MHEFLSGITRDLPCKSIVIRDETYLMRYFMFEEKSGRQKWLHNILRPDNEIHLHTHPWFAESHILNGSYTQLIRNEHGDDVEQTFKAGDINLITPETLHRIVHVAPQTWTLMIVKPHRVAEWQFVDRENNVSKEQGTGLDWWKKYLTREHKKPDLASGRALESMFLSYRLQEV